MLCHILDLPNEVLTQIFDHDDLREYDNSHCLLIDGHAPPLQQLRLVCKRFADVGARVLIPCIKVEYTPRSFARLKAVSRHPLIRARVRTVDVRMTLNHRDFAEDWRLYALMKFHEFKTFSNVAHARNSWVLDAKTARDSKIAEDEAEMFRRTCARVAASLAVPMDWSSHYFDLKEGYHRYCNVMAAQERAIDARPNTEDFIASALARFGGLRKLIFNNHYSGFPWAPCNTKDDLIQAKKGPSLWELSDKPYIQEQHRMGLVALFNACSRYNVMFRKVDLGIFGAGGVSLCPYSAGPLGGVRQVCRDLRHINFNSAAPHSYPWMPMRALETTSETGSLGDGMRSLRSLFRAFTDASDRVESIDINMFPLGHSTHQESMGTLLSTRSWKSLRSLKLTNCAINASEFVDFYKALSRPIELILVSVHVIEGTWQSILAAINGKFRLIVNITGGAIEECPDGDWGYMKKMLG